MQVTVRRQKEHVRLFRPNEDCFYCVDTWVAIHAKVAREVIMVDTSGHDLHTMQRTHDDDEEEGDDDHEEKTQRRRVSSFTPIEQVSHLPCIRILAGSPCRCTYTEMKPPAALRLHTCHRIHYSLATVAAVDSISCGPGKIQMNLR